MTGKFRWFGTRNLCRKRKPICIEQWKRLLKISTHYYPWFVYFFSFVFKDAYSSQDPSSQLFLKTLPNVLFFGLPSTMYDSQCFNFINPTFLCKIKLLGGRAENCLKSVKQNRWPFRNVTSDLFACLFTPYIHRLSIIDRKVTIMGMQPIFFIYYYYYYY